MLNGHLSLNEARKREEQAVAQKKQLNHSAKTEELTGKKQLNHSPESVLLVILLRFKFQLIFPYILVVESGETAAFSSCDSDTGVCLRLRAFFVAFEGVTSPLDEMTFSSPSSVSEQVSTFIG